MAAPDLIKTIDEFEAEYRKGIGEVLPHHPTKEASLDNIRNFCEGIGDYNPLWQDEAHAGNSRFGMITAPPSFLYSVALGVIAGETGAIDRARVSTQYLPVNYAGVEIDFHRPVWLGDRITVSETVGETIRKDQRPHRRDQLQYRPRDVHEPSPRDGGDVQDADGALREHRRHAPV